MNDERPPPLPDVFMSVLTRDDATRILDDIERCAELLAVQLKSAARTRTLESHASRVRKKLRVDPSDSFVVNVWGVGYRLLE